MCDLSVVVGGGVIIFPFFLYLGAQIRAHTVTYTHTYAISTHIQKKRRTRRYRWPPWVSIQYLCIALSGSLSFYFLPSLLAASSSCLPPGRRLWSGVASFSFTRTHTHTHTHLPWCCCFCCCCCCCCFCCSYLASTLLPPPSHLSAPLLLLVILRSFFFFVCFLLYPTRPRLPPRPSNNHR